MLILIIFRHKTNYPENMLMQKIRANYKKENGTHDVESLLYTVKNTTGMQCNHYQQPCT